MRALILLLSLSLVFAECPWYFPGERTYDTAIVPFAGSPRGYGIPFPPVISMYYTGHVELPPFTAIEISNEQYRDGEPVFISGDSPAITTDKAKNFGPRVRPQPPIVDAQVRRLLEDPGDSNEPPKDISDRHPDIERVSYPRYVNLNTSHPSLSPTFKAMIAVPGKFRVRIGDLGNCNDLQDAYVVPFGEFGFSTLPAVPIPLVSVTPSTTSDVAWPRRLTLQFNESVITRDIRQIRYEVTLDRFPKKTFVYRWSRLDTEIWSSIWWRNRRLLHAVGPVQATPNTPCLSFCEAEPLSSACQACCTSVAHETSWECGEDSQAQCCKTWEADCWDTPSEKNQHHSCNMCTAYAPNEFKVNNYRFYPGWMHDYDYDTPIIVMDNERLTWEEEDGIPLFPALRKALLHTGVTVKLVIGQGAFVDYFSRSVPNALSEWTFRVARKPLEIKFPSNGLSNRTLPRWLNFTIDGLVQWRCPSEVRAFGISHKDLAGGEVMRPGDLCRFPVVAHFVESSSPPSTDSPTPSPTSPTLSPTTPSPTAPTEVPTEVPTESPTESPTLSPQTEYPTPSPTAPTTEQPTASPTTDPFAPRIITCDWNDDWPFECPYPEYIKLTTMNQSTILSVDTTDEMFLQDFRDLNTVSGKISITLDAFSLVSTDEWPISAVLEDEEMFVQVAPLLPAGVALTSNQQEVSVGRNLVIIPPGAVHEPAVLETSIVTPPSNAPIPISEVMRIVIRLSNDSTAKIENLPEPVQMFLPIPIIEPVVATKWSPCHSPVPYHDATCVWWDEDSKDWSTGGCITDRTNSTRIGCRCDHLTDFAILQALESCQEVDPMPYYVFAGPFFCIFLYCLWAMGMVACHHKTMKVGRGPLVGQHVLMAIASMARALSPLAVSPGVSVGATSALFALPYLAKFPSFLLLVIQWATIVHFAMSTGGRRKLMMPAFVALCVVIELVVVGLFIYFHVTESIGAVVTGTITLAVLSGVFALAYLFYGYSLARTFPKNLSQPSGSSSNDKSRKLHHIRFKVQVGGFCFALLFVIEAVCHPVALSLQQQNVAFGLMAATTSFLLAEFLSYALVLWMFYPALKSLMKAASRESENAELVPTHPQSKLSSQKSASRL